jgi:hypothetical protein
MSLSRFLRDYLYIPLGGSRRGTLARHANLLATMLLGGLWHGAGWTFVVWGGLHGLFLILNHLWRVLRPAGRAAAGQRLAGWALTFLCVVVAWVFFRAPDLATAMDMLKAMAGLRGLAMPLQLDHKQMVLMAALLAMVLLAPNVPELMAREAVVLQTPGRAAAAGLPLPRLRLAWHPSTAWATACFGLFVAALLGMTGVSQFLYFRF